MKKVTVISTISFFLILALSLVAEGVVPAFPGAEGAGKYTVGGRGGRVVEVTNLNDSGAGSLRDALNNTLYPPPKIIVFRVSGTIALQSALLIDAVQPGNLPAYTTIAGQTAPGDGITLTRPLNIGGGEVIVRYIRVRPDERKGTYPATRDEDCMHIEGRMSNIIVDHCSFSWGIDETVSPQSPIPVWDPPNYYPGLDNLTVQWCILSSPLNKSVHTEGEHGKATLAYGCYGTKFSFHHNIYAHSMDRNPRIAGQRDYTIDPTGAKFDFYNNVVYNWGGAYPGFSRGANAVTQVNFVGNYYKSGVNSSGSTYAYQAVDVHGKGYFSGNRMNGVAPGNPWDLVWFYNFTQAQIDAYKQSSPLPVGNIPAENALVAYEKVLAGAGCTLPYRDSVDVQVVNEIADGTGEVIDCTTAGDFYYQIGTAKGGSANKIILASTYPGRETGQDNYYVEITGGTGAGQTRFITFYQDNTGGEPNHYFLVSPDWDVIPDSTSQYGVIVDCTKNAGGRPVLTSTTPPTDSDHDGMPDEWETAHGLNPSDANDGKTDADGDGYTNVEEYLNYLVDIGNPVGNFYLDRNVNFKDYSLLSENWLDSDCNDALIGSLDYDCDVDWEDLTIFVSKWLESSY